MKRNYFHGKSAPLPPDPGVFAKGVNNLFSDLEGTSRGPRQVLSVRCGISNARKLVFVGPKILIHEQNIKLIEQEERWYEDMSVNLIWHMKCSSSKPGLEI
ncbi:Hypothetical predicted protein [Paramuricea clavata]|uniref:Uncharacterized protein n=1 Tax=Paramuricea clavata TaxID=317549 RepID=A0A6S7IIV6_PARCT|nr:Hypothetical predicted protein [Paramuricea clavata]